MAVKKTTPAEQKPSVESKDMSCDYCGDKTCDNSCVECDSCDTCDACDTCCSDIGMLRPSPIHRAVGIAAIITLLAAGAWFGLKARNEAKQYGFIGVPIERNVITVSGEGKVNVTPDIVYIDVGQTVEKKTVAEAQAENTRVMNAFIAALEQLGVVKADVQTVSYNMYPAYDWTDNKQVLRGYSVNQSVRVKVRDSAKSGEILAKAGELGLNQVSGLSVAVDDPEAARAEARDLAIANAREKADHLAKVMGVSLRRVVSFSEYDGSSTPVNNVYMMDRAASAGYGGAEAASIEAGTSEIIVNASVTYEIE